ncbi:hypothetical protein AT269_17805 [Bacillus cereus]|uniref:Uncharacterized protein n=1 Tax=Bacillus mycoides TaxID=1405 RepID=A0A653WWU3_BACMY|nr:hypothetical protein [Bacillus mycoides]KXY27343.1 hypothetical protein AT269_17805 [Bacillus cereus]MBM6647627.1 hypothetical protein [Bacillus sp. RIT 809]VXC23432.1 conserved hypothetical protein [Bacillus mycoides]
MNWSDYLLWTCMIIQMIVFFLLIKLVTDFLNRFQTQVGMIEITNSAELKVEDEDLEYSKNKTDKN